jgi:hypothetical protein
MNADSFTFHSCLWKPRDSIVQNYNIISLDECEIRSIGDIVF